MRTGRYGTAEAVIAHALDTLVEAGPRPTPHPTRESLHKLFAQFAKYSDKVPDLPDEAFERESIYQDHD